MQPIQGQGELILYQTDDGQAKINLKAIDGGGWLTQLEIAELFAATKQNVSLHIKNVLKDGELLEDSDVKESLTSAADGKICRVDKRSASTSAVLNLVDTRFLSTLPPATLRKFRIVEGRPKGTIQKVLTVRRKNQWITRRHGLSLPGFMAFNPAYALRHTGRYRLARLKASDI